MHKKLNTIYTHIEGESTLEFYFEERYTIVTIYRNGRYEEIFLPNEVVRELENVLRNEVK